jgi:outer membrane protein assembly factor BamB/RNA polymerase subunit RPABC4/transcription elongation factor Spt4
MTSPGGLETRWNVSAADRVAGSAILDGILYIADGTDIVGYDLGTGTANTRIANVNVRELTASDEHRLLAGVTENSVVTIDPRNEQVRWEWNDFWTGGNCSLTAMNGDLYVAAQGEFEEFGDSEFAEGYLFQFKNFNDTPSRQTIYDSISRGYTSPVKFGPLKASDTQLYVTAAGNPPVFVRWQSINNEWSVDLDEPPFAFDVGYGTAYVISNPTRSQSHVEAFDATTGVRKWKTPITQAYNIVAADGAAVIGEESGIVALDESTGSIKWENYEYEPGDLAAADGRIFAIGTDGRTACLSVFDREDGSLLSETELDSRGQIHAVLDDSVICSTGEYHRCLDRPAGTETKENSETSTTSTQFCSGCGTAVSPEANFCSNCGTEISTDGCPNCGATLDGDEAFCPQCGSELTG